MSMNLKALIPLAIFSLGLTAGWAVNGWRKDAELSEVRVSNATILRDIADKTAAAALAFRDTEIAWRTRIDKEASDGQDRINLARRDAAGARTERDRMRDELSRYRATARASCNPGSAAAGPAAADAIDLLADLLSQADARAGELAEFADAAHAAGLTCERSYEALTKPSHPARGDTER